MFLSFLLVAAQVVLVGDSTLQVRPDGAPQAGSQATPYTHLNYLEDADEFRFAIIPDRYGADYRAKDYHSDYRGGFTNAIRVVNLLRPNFVMSVGDLIPYGWEGEASIRQQHRELKDELKKVVPPFFFVVGNHDISRSSEKPGHEHDSEVSTRVWKDNWGPDTYYSFVYGNCLFVALNTIDDRTLTAKHKDISDRQYAWFAKTLKDHPNVRWTFVFMHQPAVWTSPRWLDFELKNLVQRKYTVFAGDWHQYLHVRRHDHDYYVLATAGGCAGGGLAGKDMDKRGLLYGRAYGELDHVMWITMTKEGPVIANIDVTGVLNHDFVNQKTTKSLADSIELGYPPDPEVRRHMDEQKRRKAAIDAGEIPEPQPEDCKAGSANALKEMLEFARAAEKELKHTPTCGEKQSAFGSGDSTPRAVRTAICTMAVFDTLGKSGVEDAAHWEKLAAEVDKTLFFAAKTSVGKSNEALFKCFDGRNWGELGLQGFTEDFPRLEDADPFMKGNPRPLTVRTDPDWFPGVAEAELPIAGTYDRDARRAERAYRASCRDRGVPYAPPGRDVRTGGFLGLVKGVELAKGWYEGDDYLLDTEIRETAPMGEGEGPNTVLRRQLHVRGSAGTGHGLEGDRPCGRL